LLLIQLLQHIVNYLLMKEIGIKSVGLETVKDVIADLEQALS
jgi:hypothetical protein